MGAPGLAGILDGGRCPPALRGRTVAVLGYGNQGRAQSLNMRDSGVDRVIVGSLRDAGWDRAAEDGFPVYPIGEAAERGDVILMLIPDEAQPSVFNSQVRDKLDEGDALVFAHGYNIHFGFVSPPEFVDVVLVAPRMIGWGLRELYLKGVGAPAYVAVHQDYSGKALDTALALARAIGVSKTVMSSFAEETEIDLYMEQALWAVITRLMLLSFEVLVEEGYPPEVVALELYGSGEASEVMKAMAEIGFYKQMSLHSQTSQYGTLSRGPLLIGDEFKEKLKGVLEEIRTGRFAREWALEQMLGYPVFKKLKDRALKHPINKAEEEMRKSLTPGGEP
ncbi:MAG: ketol-acid reductoisomerase [Candidatus Bathyarchaeia archaeon]